MQNLFYLMCGFSLLGVLDVGYFHIYRFRLYKQVSSRGEQITHLFREILFLTILLWVMFVHAQGVYALVLPLLLLADLINSLTDVLLEPKSRSSLGGIPPLEYLIHMLTMLVSGAIIALAVRETLKVISLKPEWSVELLTLPRPAAGFGLQVILITIGLFLFETILFMRGK